MAKPVDNPREENMIRVFSVSSGKGGVGKSNVVINLAIAMSKLGKKSTYS